LTSNAKAYAPANQVGVVRRETIALPARIVVVILPLHAAVPVALPA
jgi:hypothetical protein